VTIEVRLLGERDETYHAYIQDAAARFGRFLEQPVSVRWI
jgi:hypothetical protein